MENRISASVSPLYAPTVHNNRYYFESTIVALLLQITLLLAIFQLTSRKLHVGENAKHGERER